MAKKQVETTQYSLSNDAPVQPDRRQDDRYVSLLRVGALIVEGRRELCLIRNISAGGMMIRPFTAMPLGTSATVELKHGQAVDGMVQWSDRGFVGITFAEPVDVLALLAATGDKPRPRMPRIELTCSAVLRCDGDVSRIRLVNISQGGACIASTSELELNANVVLSLPGLYAAAGVVKWRDDDQYGIGFNRVYPLDELMAFLKDQQREELQQRAVA